MATLYGPRSWIEGRWPFRPEPQDDELLTSYLARVAQGTGMKPITFLNATFGSSRSLLCQDLDNFASEPVLARLAEGSGLSEDRILAMTFAEFAGRLNATHVPRARKAWILPTTIFANGRLRAGLQYCPGCLRQDARPYLRRRWRLAFATTCTMHGTMLRDSCRRCGAFVHPHRAPSLRTCHACGRDLTGADAIAPAPAEVLEQQSFFEEALNSGWAVLGDRPVHSTLAFIVVRRVAGLLVNGPDADAFRQATVRLYGGSDEAFDRETTKAPLEYLGVEQRHRMFDLVRRVIVDFPERLVTICREVGLKRSKIIKDMPYVPFVLDEALKAHLEDKYYHASEEEVAGAARWLRKNRGMATYRDLKAHCGESRDAIYRHMDYERVQRSPSWRRSRAIDQVQGQTHFVSMQPGQAEATRSGGRVRSERSRRSARGDVVGNKKRPRPSPIEKRKHLIHEVADLDRSKQGEGRTRSLRTSLPPIKASRYPSLGLKAPSCRAATRAPIGCERGILKRRKSA